MYADPGRCEGIHQQIVQFVERVYLLLDYLTTEAELVIIVHVISGPM
jgi:hypothetical protein